MDDIPDWCSTNVGFNNIPIILIWQEISKVSHLNVPKMHCIFLNAFSIGVSVPLLYVHTQTPKYTHIVLFILYLYNYM